MLGTATHLVTELRLGSLISILIGLTAHRSLTTLHFNNGLTINIRSSIDDLRVLSDSVLTKQYGKPMEGDIVVDIGAYIGDFSVFAAWCGATVFAYEPVPENFRLARLNILCNKLNERVKVSNAAVTDGLDDQGFIQMDYDPRRPHLASSHIKRGEEAIHVPCVALQDIFEDNHITRCDLLKMDCEGSEYGILLTAPYSILEKIRRIALEYHPISNPRLEELVTRLKSRGFLVEIYPYPLRSGAQGGYLHAVRP